MNLIASLLMSTYDIPKVILAPVLTHGKQVTCTCELSTCRYFKQVYLRNSQVTCTCEALYLNHIIQKDHYPT